MQRGQRATVREEWMTPEEVRALTEFAGLSYRVPFWRMWGKGKDIAEGPARGGDSRARSGTRTLRHGREAGSVRV